MLLYRGQRCKAQISNLVSVCNINMTNKYETSAYKQRRTNPSFLWTGIIVPSGNDWQKWKINVRNWIFGLNSNLFYGPIWHLFLSCYSSLSPVDINGSSLQLWKEEKNKITHSVRLRFYHLFLSWPSNAERLTLFSLWGTPCEWIQDVRWRQKHTR